MAAKKPKARPRNAIAKSRFALAGLIAILLAVGGITVWWLWPSQPDLEAELPAPAPVDEPPVTTAEVTPGTDEPAEPPATAEATPETDEPAEPPATAEATPEPDEPAEPPATAEATPEPDEPTEPPVTAEPAPGTEQPAEPPTTTAALTPGTGAPEEPSEPAPPPPPETEEASAPPKALDCPANADAAPGCALAEHVLRTLDASGAAPPKVTLNRPGGIYLDREFLVVETELPAEAGGYLYLDVLTDAGDVYHLLPEPMRQDNELPAGGEIRVGVERAERRDGVRHWQVGEPFGKGYLLALVSEKPLYDELRPIEESIADYRDVLLKALAVQGTGRKSAQITQIEFRPRG